MYHNVTDRFNYKLTYKIPRSFPTPQLKYDKTLDQDHVLNTINTDQGIPLSKVIGLLQSGEQAYYSPNDLVLERSKLKHWFSKGTSGRAITLIMAIIGTLSGAILVVYMAVYYRQQRVMQATIAGCVMSKVLQPTQAQELNTMANPTIPLELSYYRLPKHMSEPLRSREQETYEIFAIQVKLEYLIIFLIIIFSIYLAKYIYKRFLKFRIFTPTLKDDEGQFQSRFYLDLNSQSEAVQVYLTTVNLCVINLTVPPHMEVRSTS